MKKYFVPYDIALALKEIGFDEECLGKWTRYNEGDPIDLYPESQNFFKGPWFNGCTNEEYRKGDEKDKVAAPLYDQVIDWFIEKHRISMSSNVSVSGLYSLEMWTWLGDAKGWDRELGQYGFENRYTALNTGILKAIELVKQKV